MTSLVNPSLLNILRDTPERVITVSSFRGLTQCPRQFTLKHSAARIEEDSSSLRQGNRWHSVLEALYQGKEHPENDDTVKAFTQEWDDLSPVLSPEQPFLFEYNGYVIGGVIDLVVRSTGGGEDAPAQGKDAGFESLQAGTNLPLPSNHLIWCLDWKVSTGQFMSNLPEMMSREQLGIYTLALREAGVPCAGGILSRIKFEKDLSGDYVRSLAAAEGVNPPTEGGITRTEDGRIVSAVLVSGTTVLRVEREYFTFTDCELLTIASDLTEGWEQLYGKSFRVRGQQCKYCGYAKMCQEQAAGAGEFFPIERERLHPELLRRLASAQKATP